MSIAARRAYLASVLVLFVSASPGFAAADAAASSSFVVTIPGVASDVLASSAVAAAVVVVELLRSRYLARACAGTKYAARSAYKMNDCHAGKFAPLLASAVLAIAEIAERSAHPCASA